MSKRHKLLQRILGGHSDAGIRFNELRRLLRNSDSSSAAVEAIIYSCGETSPRESTCREMASMRNRIRYGRFGG